MLSRCLFQIFCHQKKWVLHLKSKFASALPATCRPYPVFKVQRIQTGVLCTWNACMMPCLCPIIFSCFARFHRLVGCHPQTTDSTESDRRIWMDQVHLGPEFLSVLHIPTLRGSRTLGIKLRIVAELFWIRQNCSRSTFQTLIHHDNGR